MAYTNYSDIWCLFRLNWTWLQLESISSAHATNVEVRESQSRDWEGSEWFTIFWEWCELSNFLCEGYSQHLETECE